MATHPRIPAVLALILTALTLGACGHNPGGFGPTAQLSDRECLARVMYFESNRSSDDGMLAVGTVVMNRLQSPKYPKSVCGVVGQQNQFAQGALTNHVNKRHSSWARAERAADAVLAGERHAGVGRAMFFHTAGHSFPYRNMKYVTLAGGNMFYDKRYPDSGSGPWPSANAFARNFGKPAQEASPIMVAEAKPARSPRPEPLVLASAEPASARRFEVDEDAEERPAPARRAGPLVLASAKPAQASRFEADEDAEERPAPARRAGPLVLASAQPAQASRFEADEDADERPAPARRAGPLVLASARFTPAKPEPATLAAKSPAKPAQPVLLAAHEPPARRAPAFNPAQIASVLAKRPHETPKAVQVAAHQPPAKPKPIVLAMVDTKHRSGGMSITALIERDTRKR